MPIKSRENLWGAWAFLIGVVLAVLVGIFSRNNTDPIFLGILAVLGLLLGFFVSQNDVQVFLLASAVLVLVSFAGIQGIFLDAAIRGIAIGKMVSAVLSALLVMFVPATVIVALKTMFSIAQR
jgi:hypothetical protein